MLIFFRICVQPRKNVTPTATAAVREVRLALTTTLAKLNSNDILRLEKLKQRRQDGRRNSQRDAGVTLISRVFKQFFTFYFLLKIFPSRQL